MNIRHCLLIVSLTAYSNCFAQLNNKKTYPIFKPTDSALQNRAFSVYTISPQYYRNQLGFICKQELALQKITRVPFRLRLGSKEYVDYLEGKNWPR